jgi:UDP-N-acetylglucosamine 2-epimerase (non-hydrolysing)
LVLVTAHRRESFGDGFRDICHALLRLATRPDVDIVYPVHPNPNVRATVLDLLSGHPRIRLIDPVGYAEMVYLMKRATVLLTDSGGLQEEGPALGKPVLVLRDVTERPEAVATGVVELVGTNPERIASRVERLLDDPVAFAACARVAFPYGNGTAARAIVDAIESTDLG